MLFICINVVFTRYGGIIYVAIIEIVAYHSQYCVYIYRFVELFLSCDFLFSWMPRWLGGDGRSIKTVPVIHALWATSSCDWSSVSCHWDDGDMLVLVRRSLALLVFTVCAVCCWCLLIARRCLLPVFPFVAGLYCSCWRSSFLLLFVTCAYHSYHSLHF